MKNIRCGFTVLVGIILSLNTSLAQTILGTTNTGERIIPNDSGTWKIDNQDTLTNGDPASLQAKVRMLEALAKNEARRADRSRYLAVANEMAIRSSDFRDQEQEALFALQAFNFNKKYGGYQYSNNIYNGLLSALKRYDHPSTRSLAKDTTASSTVVSSLRENTIYSAGRDGKVIRWNSQDRIWKSEKLFSQGNDYQILSIDVSPNGDLLAAGGTRRKHIEKNYVELFDLRNFNIGPRKIEGYKSSIDNIHFTPDSKGFFALCNSGRTIMYSDLLISKEIVASSEKVTSIDLSPDGTQLADVSAEGTLLIWNIKDNYALTKYPIFKEKTALLAVAFSPDNRFLLIGDENGEVRIVQNGIVRRVLSGHKTKIVQIKFNHSGKFLATSSKDGTIRLWNLEALNEQPLRLNTDGWATALGFTLDDSQLVASIRAEHEGIASSSPIHVWPTKLDAMANSICGLITRNMTMDEWNQIARELPYEQTCISLQPNNK